MQTFSTFLPYKHYLDRLSLRQTVVKHETFTVAPLKKAQNFALLRNKITTFAVRIMRKSAYITLSILLSTMILWIGSGIMTVVCEHTGSVSVAEIPSKMHCKDAAASNCMKMQVKTLSPTNAERADFHQPLPVQFSLLPQLITDCDLLPLPVLAKASERTWQRLWHGPPRQYLRLLTTLLI
mgnify:CR=1 FL=1